MAPRLLIERGWAVRLLADVFPQDAQNTGDPEWLDYCFQRGWYALTQDRRIQQQVAAQRSMRDHHGLVFCLSSSELSIQDKVDYFHNNLAKIHRKIRRRDMGFYVVYDGDVIRRWPETPPADTP